MFTPIYVVFETYETCNGPIIAAFREREHADAAAKGKGWYGSNGVVEPAKLYNHIKDFTIEQLESARLSGLDKLTALEKEALGL